MTAARGGRSAKGLVLRNALFLVGGQLLGAPVAVLVNAALARYLGPAEFGRLFLASTLVQFGLMLVEWGQSGVLPARVALEPGRAGTLLGTALAWRLCAATVMYALLAGGCLALGYENEFLVILALVAVQWLLGSLGGAIQDTVRGFERTDVGAISQMGQQVLVALILIPTLVLGGRLRAALIVHIVGPGLVLFVLWRTLRKLGVGALTVRRDTLLLLLRQGGPFVLFGVATLLQTNVDAVLLSRLSPPEVVGWNAVARRLLGTLVLPAAALVSAMYPTLARLHKEDSGEFLETTRSALRGTIVLAVPLAVCCWVYRDVGLLIFGHAGFGPAEGNLRILSIFLFLMYVSMPIGSALMAAGRQKQWAFAQFVCVVVSVGLDPFLIPWFQTHYGNGGLGVCTASTVSEVFMVAIAIMLFPGRLFDRLLLLTAFRTWIAGLVMIGVARLLFVLSPFVAAPIVVAAYLGCLWAIGGIDREQAAQLREFIARRRGRP